MNRHRIFLLLICTSQLPWLTESSWSARLRSWIFGSSHTISPKDDSWSPPGHSPFLNGGKFNCSSGGVIPASWACDQESDCKNGEDEAISLCANRTCADDSNGRRKFKCGLNQSPNVSTTPSSRNPESGSVGCIYYDWTCDGQKDCFDGSDEDSFMCSKEEECGARNAFLCPGTTQCVPRAWLCDGTEECPGGEDENVENCPKNRRPEDCTKDEFSCAMSHECIPASYRCDRVQDCVDGTDEDDCQVGGNGTMKCGDNEMQCHDGSQCVSRFQLCDHSSDCTDGSDEHLAICQFDDVNRCERRTDFSCKDDVMWPKCISRRYICDGYRDCPTGLDEATCTTTDAEKGSCPKDTESCKVKHECIDSKRWCDGRYDCQDKSDEVYCTNAPQLPVEKKCNELSEFTCSPGVCIPKNKVCDKQFDCSDGSDERDCYLGVSLHKKDACETASPGRCKHGRCVVASAYKDLSYYCECPPGFDDRLEYDEEKRLYMTCKDKDECASHTTNNCSQFCINTVGSYYCRCDSPYYSLANGHECFAVIPPSLVLATQTSISLLSPPSTHTTFSKRTIVFPRHSTFFTSVDYSLEQNLIFSLNKLNRTISVTHIPQNLRTIKNNKLPDHLANTVFVANVKIRQYSSRPKALAYDWVHRNLYFSDESTRSISVVDYQKNIVATVLTEDAKHDPSAIVIHPGERVFYYVAITRVDNLDEMASIRSAGLDGSQQIIIKTFPNSRPVSLAIDRERLRLYWSDARLGLVCRCNTDGSSGLAHDSTFCLPLTHGPGFHLSSHAYRFSTIIDIFEDSIFWSNVAGRKISESSIFNGSLRTSRSRFANFRLDHMNWPVNDIKIIHEDKQPKYPNVCQHSTCSHFCLPTPNRFVLRDDRKNPSAPSYRCLCADGYKSQAGSRDCIEDSNRLPRLKYRPTSSSTSSNSPSTSHSPSNSRSTSHSPSASNSHSASSTHSPLVSASLSWRGHPVDSVPQVEPSHDPSSLLHEVPVATEDARLTNDKTTTTAIVVSLIILILLLIIVVAVYRYRNRNPGRRPPIFQILSNPSIYRQRTTRTVKLSEINDDYYSNNSKLQDEQNLADNDMLSRDHEDPEFCS